MTVIGMWQFDRLAEEIVNACDDVKNRMDYFHNCQWRTGEALAGDEGGGGSWPNSLISQRKSSGCRLTSTEARATSRSSHRVFHFQCACFGFKKHTNKLFEFLKIALSICVIMFCKQNKYSSNLTK